MVINSARFIISSQSVEKSPETELHEYAFIGRSNVGKSSLINMLTNKKGLAMTSSKPGKTMLINHFLINDKWYIVDLPGYGYAQRSKTDLARIDKMIKDYILNRAQMTNLFLLIDSRLEPQKIDLKFMEWLAENSIPFSIVFTKLDKMSKTKGLGNVTKYTEKLLEEWEELPPIFLTSSNDGRGRDEILDYIEQLNKIPVEIIESPQPNNSSTMDAKYDKEEIKAEEIYPGVAIDAADDDKVTEEEIKERTDILDDNPRDHDM